MSPSDEQELTPESVAGASSTATTSAARQHARSMAGTVVDAMPVVPPNSAHITPPGVHPDQMLWHETVAGGGYTSLAVARGTMVRLVDLDGDACAGVLLHRHAHPSERLNVADTVKVQWQAYLHEQQLLLSDMGRVLASIVKDTSGHHDTICGTTNRAANAAAYGDGSVEGPSPNGRDLFALALSKNGRTRRDIAPNVNFFKGTRVEPDGTLMLLPSAPAGSEVILRAEMDVLITIVNVAHPLDDRETYTVGRLGISAWSGEPPTPSDAVRHATPESLRAFQNTEMATALLA